MKKKLVRRILNGLEPNFHVDYVCPVCEKESYSIEQSLEHLYTHSKEEISDKRKRINKTVVAMKKDLESGKNSDKQYIKMIVRTTDYPDATARDPVSLHKILEERSSEIVSRYPKRMWTVFTVLTQAAFYAVLTWASIHSAVQNNSWAGARTSVLVCLIYWIMDYLFEKRGLVIALPFSRRWALITAVVSIAVSLLLINL